MLSMTGFGAGKAPLASARAGAGTREAQAEASSVNRKGLEFSISLPREWAALEAPLTELARARLHRGQVRLTVAVNEPGANGAPSWDEAAVGEALEQLRALAKRLGVSFQPDGELLWRLAQGTGGEAATTPAEEAWPAVQAAATAALEQLVAARGREGEALQRDLAARLALLSRLREEIAPLAGESVTRYREGLHGRLRQIGLEIDLNDERILREIALFADRCDIAEELTRLESHLAQFAKTLGADGPVGRQLDFLCQEIHREINTIGSKAQHVEITRRVLEAKNEIERIREQVQNVE
jgi:uncharacterized protein (TIGR00255 family)